MFEGAIIGSKTLLAAVIDKERTNGVLQSRITELERMNARLQADMDWAKHRLNQVERERAQLIASAIGVKIAVPEFQPTYRPDEALNEASMPFPGVGEDSTDPADKLTGADGVDYSRMPGYRGN